MTTKGRVRKDGSRRARYRRGAEAQAEIARLEPMFNSVRTITVDVWKAWVWAWSCIGQEYAVRMQVGWPLPHTFFAQRKKSLPNPFGTSHPTHKTAELPIETPLAVAYGGVPDGTSARVNDGKTHFEVTRAVAETLLAARDAIQRLILLGDFGRYDDQRSAWEQVVAASWVLGRPPEPPADGVGWPMPRLAWQAALERRTDGKFLYEGWNDAELELQRRVAGDTSDRIVATAKRVSAQAITKKRGARKRNHPG